MIKDKLSNAERYSVLSKGINKGLEYLKNTDITKLPDGKYPIDGERVFVNINSYTSKDEADWEAHARYIDIQYIAQGAEKIGICERRECSLKIPYDQEKDIEFLSGSGGDYCIMQTGDFMIIYPDEIHKPAVKIDENIYVKKAIIKAAAGY